MAAGILQQAAMTFQRLLPIEYRIVLAKKGASHKIRLCFVADNFYHLSGMHKVKNSDAVRLDRLKFFRKALDGKYDDKILEGHEVIVNRLKALIQLENLLSDNRTEIFGYCRNRCRFPTKIAADYVLKCKINSEKIIFTFFVKQDTDDNLLPNSIFPETSKDFAAGQTKYAVLLKEKFDKTTNETTELFRRKNYNPD